MYINAIQTNCIPKANYGNIKITRHFVDKNNKPCDIFIRQNSKLNFRGKPSKLYYGNFGISKHDEISAETAIEIFKELKYQKYTDIPQPNWNFEYEAPNDDIREHNLRFLDNIKSSEEKKKFISYYEQLTGFPDLEVCSDKIKDEFCNVSKNAVKHLASEGIKVSVTDIGYNDTCSVGHKKALPGSDMDGGYIILDTDEATCYYNYDKDIINIFKEYLWNNTDARILSYNHIAAFPQVYSKRQINNLLNSLEEETQKMNLSETTYSRGLFHKTTMLKHYQDLLETYNANYSIANQFCIQLSKRLEDTYITDYGNPSKELAKNFGFLAETIVNGKSLAKEQGLSCNNNPLREKFCSTQYAKLVNLSQLHILKRNPPPKQKLGARKQLVEIYKNASVDEKYEIIREIIRAGCGHNNNEKFSKYFDCGEDKFTPLLKELKR